jgi:hypothetical protein
LFEAAWEVEKVEMAEPGRVEVRNLTPHRMEVHAADGHVHVLEPAPRWARADETFTPTGVLPGWGVEVGRMRYGRAHDLPDPQPGVYLVVSQIVARACGGRSDLLVPIDLVRNPAGDVIGCRRFAVAFD